MQNWDFACTQDPEIREFTYFSELTKLDISWYIRVFFNMKRPTGNPYSKQYWWAGAED